MRLDITLLRGRTTPGFQARTTSGPRSRAVLLRIAAAFWTMVLLHTATAIAQTTAADSVRKLDAAWANAYFTHDTTFARNLLSADIVITATDGSLKNREGEIADVRPYPGMSVNYFKSTGVNVRAYAGTCVVTGQLEWELVQGGNPVVSKRRYTATYVRGGTLGWQMVGLHIGRAP